MLAEKKVSKNGKIFNTHLLTLNDEDLIKFLTYVVGYFCCYKTNQVLQLR